MMIHKLVENPNKIYNFVCVCVFSLEGELQLPHDSVRKILSFCREITIETSCAFLMYSKLYILELA